MALYRLESDRTQIGIDLDTKTRDNNLRHPDYARHAQIMRLVYVQSLLSGQSILQTIPSLAVIGNFVSSKIGKVKST
ncbi:hypothetical protein [uncultured Alistipes sp.]|uniref:hypothetical protein n=1 Tax=uncultured Alistipes sp. TaxID=538949 RepID=UPI0025993FC6|nr:hypothetical protein [uncultured Alistipes sp.]